MDLFADTIALVQRTQPEQLFLVRMVAVPAPDNPEVSEVGGAYANCWVNADDLRSAEQITLEAVSQEGWFPQKFKRWELVSRLTYQQDATRSPTQRAELLEQVAQAFENGHSLVFYCWPLDSPDAADDA